MDKVLIVRLRLMGDIIFTIPSIQMFKEKYPQTEIYYVVEEKFREIAELIPGIDHLLIIPHKMTIRDIIKFRKKIKKIGFHTAIDFHSGPKSAMLTFISGAKNRIGYITPNRNWAFTQHVPRKKKKYPTHSVFNQACLLESFGINISKIPPYPKIKLKKSTISDIVIKEVNETREKRIVIHLGAKNKFRDWGIDNFRRLIEQFLKKGLRVVLIGHQNEEIERGRFISEKLKIVNLCGKINITDLLYLIEASGLYIGADSGPLHLATLTSTPIVGLYGPNIPEISGPFRKKDVEVVQIKMDCQPCSQKKCIYDKIKCMKNISVEEVYEKSFKYLQ